MFVSFSMLLFFFCFLLLLLHTRTCLFMHMFTHAHVYTIHYIELLKVHLMVKSACLYLLLFAFGCLSKKKGVHSEFPIWKRLFRSCGCETSKKEFKQWLSRNCHGSRFGLVVNALDFNWECFLLLVTFLCWAASSNLGETLEFLFLKVKVVRLSWNFFRQQSQA